jgi:hypothetical protein
MSKSLPPRIWVTTVLLATLLYSLAAEADCVLPAAPSHIPDGSSASEQEMIAAMKILKQYNDDVDEYTKCLDFERRQNRISIDLQEAHRSSALNLLATVVARFNEQVRRFKSRRT